MFSPEPDPTALDIHSDRLQLRIASLADAEAVYRLRADPSLKYLESAFRPDSELVVAEEISDLRDQLTVEKEIRNVEWVIRRERTFIGTIRGKLEEVGAARRVQTSTFVDPSQQSHGYGPEAREAVWRFCAEKFGVEQVWAEVDPANCRSWLLLDQHGLTCLFEGSDTTYQMWAGRIDEVLLAAEAARKSAKRDH